MKLKLSVSVITLLLLFAGCNADRAVAVSPSGDATQEAPSVIAVTPSPQMEKSFVTGGEIDKDAVMAAYRENPGDTAERLAKLYLDSIKDGVDLAKGEDAIAMFDLLFDRQTLAVTNLRPSDTMPDSYKGEMTGSGPNGDRSVPLIVIFQNDDPRFFCPLSRYGKQSRISVEAYINCLAEADAVKLSQWLSIDGGSETFLDEANDLIDYYRQYELSKTEIVGFDYDSSLNQFVYYVKDGRNETFAIFMNYGDGFSMPDTSYVLEKPSLQ